MCLQFDVNHFCEIIIKKEISPCNSDEFELLDFFRFKFF